MTSKVQAEPNQCDLAPETPTDAFRKDKVFHVFQPLFYFSQLLQDIFLAQPDSLNLLRMVCKTKMSFFISISNAIPLCIFISFSLAPWLRPHGSYSGGPWRTKCVSACRLFLHTTDRNGAQQTSTDRSNANQTISGKNNHSKTKNWYWYPRHCPRCTGTSFSNANV